MKDYLESSYSQSILLESVDCTFQYLVQNISQELSEICNENSEILMMRIIPVLFRCRNLLNNVNPIIKGLQEDKQPNKNDKKKPKEEAKVVELNDEEAEQELKEENIVLDKEELESTKEVQDMDSLPVIKDENNEQDYDEKVQNIVKSIQLFTKLILTEGIERSDDMVNIGEMFGMGGNSSEMGLLQGLMTGG